jgi:hypothetical protein
LFETLWNRLRGLFSRELDKAAYIMRSARRHRSLDDGDR